MLAMLLILAIALSNFALGFCLAIHLGHGPVGWRLPTVEVLRMKLRAVLRLDRQSGQH